MSSPTPQNLQQIIYAAYLVRKTQETPISFSLVTRGQIREISRMQGGGELPFPVIVDKDNSIARQAHIREGEDTFLVFDRKGVISFASPLGLESPEDLRELWELHTQGSIQFSEAHRDAEMQVGRHFPDVILANITTGTTTDSSHLINDSQHRFLVFTAECPVCSLESSMTGIAANHDAVPIFSSHFSTSLLKELVLRKHVQVAVYSAEGELSGLENLYSSHSTFENAGVVIDVDASGVIMAINPIPLS
ncbi:MAG TPA: hypothetical protein VGN16_11050 [Acidobacteriaceae bacterium]|jgi:hypothetical protein